MNRDLDQTDVPVELGAASAETKGVSGPPRDEAGLFILIGLSDD